MEMASRRFVPGFVNSRTLVADLAADDKGGGKQEDIFDDVPPFQGEADGEAGKADLRQQDEGKHGAGQQESASEQRPVKEPDADGDLPPAENRDKGVRREPVDRLPDEVPPPGLFPTA